jgi:predicted dehydrogenase
MVYTVKWGILATGSIGRRFAIDLLIDPTTRGVNDIKHEVVAVGSSSSIEKAEQLIKTIGAPASTAAYGSYDELVNDPNVDVIYVATPQNCHYANTKSALEAGKHVLCEKPFTINAEQIKHLKQIAEEKNLFLMEAVWTRFFPLVLDLQKKLFEDRVIGKVHRTSADLGRDLDLDNISYSHRLIDPGLGGGAMLDMGIYALTWVFLINYWDPDNKRTAPRFHGTMIKTPISWVDEHTAIVFAFDEGRTSAVATTSMSSASDCEAPIRIEGSKGVVTVQWAPYSPASYTVYKYIDKEQVGDGEVHTFPIPVGRGMFWQADEVARCLRDGKKESDRMSLDESILITSVMDKVRFDNDFRYPEHLESTSK